MISISTVTTSRDTLFFANLNILIFQIQKQIFLKAYKNADEVGYRYSDFAKEIILDKLNDIRDEFT